MDITVVSRDGDRVQVAVLGNISLGTSSLQEDPLSEVVGDQVYGQLVLLDLSRVPMIDSSGVGWLLRCQKRFSHDGGRMVVHSIAPAVKSVLKVLKLDHVLSIAVDAPGAQEILEGEKP